MITEAYDKIDGKWVKDESEYKHFVNKENFHKIVNSGYLKGTKYASNTFNYGKRKYAGKEICMVRSDRVPNNPEILSANTGDIKFCFRKEKLNTRYKTKPIQEFQIDAQREFKIILRKIKKNLLFDLKEKTKLSYRTKIALKLLEQKKWELSEQEISFIFNQTLKYNLDKTDYDYIKFQITKSIPKLASKKEKMEERVQANKLTFDYIDKVMIPTYYEKDPQVIKDAANLVAKGVKVVWYQVNRKIEESYFTY